MATTLGEYAALGYMISGSVGAATLAGTTGLFARFERADAAGRAVVTELYAMLFGMVYEGLWNTLCMSLLAVWLLLGGRMLALRSRALGFTMMALGACSVLDVAGGLLHLEAVSMAGLFGYLIGFPFWSAALGLAILRRGTLA